MNNDEIIRKAAIEIFGAKCVNDLLARGEEIPLHTLNRWKMKIGECAPKEGATGITVKMWKLDAKSMHFYLGPATLYKRDDLEELPNQY